MVRNHCKALITKATMEPLGLVTVAVADDEGRGFVCCQIG